MQSDIFPARQESDYIIVTFNLSLFIPNKKRIKNYTISMFRNLNQLKEKKGHKSRNNVAWCSAYTKSLFNIILDICSFDPKISLTICFSVPLGIGHIRVIIAFKTKLRFSFKKKKNDKWFHSD